MIEEQRKAVDTLKAVHDDGFAEINGRKYEFQTTTHVKRRSIFAFYSAVGGDVKNENFSFMDTERFVQIEKKILEMTTFEGMQLSKIPDHWDKHPEDYLMFILTAMGAISYPFLSASHTA